MTDINKIIWLLLRELMSILDILKSMIPLLHQNCIVDTIFDDSGRWQSICVGNMNLSLSRLYYYCWYTQPPTKYYVLYLRPLPLFLKALLCEKVHLQLYHFHQACQKYLLEL